MSEGGIVGRREGAREGGRKLREGGREERKGKEGGREENYIMGLQGNLVTAYICTHTSIEKNKKNTCSLYMQTHTSCTREKVGALYSAASAKRKSGSSVQRCFCQEKEWELCTSLLLPSSVEQTDMTSFSCATEYSNGDGF